MHLVLPLNVHINSTHSGLKIITMYCKMRRHCIHSLSADVNSAQGNLNECFSITAALLWSQGERDELSSVHNKGCSVPCVVQTAGRPRPFTALKHHNKCF